MKRVFLQFSFRQGWFCQFLEEDRKTPLPRTVLLSDEGKLFELVKRDGFTLNISGRQEIEEAIRKKRGGVWLELTPEQYAKLRPGVVMPKKACARLVIGVCCCRSGSVFTGSQTTSERIGICTVFVPPTRQTGIFGTCRL